MYLEHVRKHNPGLIQTAVKMHQDGTCLPDSYIVDMDQLMANATLMLNHAKKQKIDLYFMLKQLGRNPYIAKKLVEIGYQGAVVVDFKEALLMMEHHIPLSNVGNLVQIPKALMKKIMSYGTEYITVFSFETAVLINDVARELGVMQKIMLRVYGRDDMIYSGQEAGIALDELPAFIESSKELEHIQIGSVTSFPCYLYDTEAHDIVEQANLESVLNAAQMLRESGVEVMNINAPSSTCSYLLPKMKKAGVISGEPGHGLTGSTPAHLHLDLEEKPCVVYLTEVSHSFQDKSYCYGGGYYRRSHVQTAIVGNDSNTMVNTTVIPPNVDSIDYYFGLGDRFPIGESVLMAFRFQIFVTRSDVVLVEGIATDHPKIIGIYDSLGKLK